MDKQVIVSSYAVEQAREGIRLALNVLKGWKGGTAMDRVLLRGYNELGKAEPLQWKYVAEGLPEVSGLYVVSVKARGLMITGFASDSDSDKWRWEEKYDRYIPYPIPPYEKKPENG